MKGKVTACDHREYGFAQLQVSKIAASDKVDTLFDTLGDEMQVSIFIDTRCSKFILLCILLLQGVDVSR